MGGLSAQLAEYETDVEGEGCQVKCSMDSAVGYDRVSVAGSERLPIGRHPPPPTLLSG